MTSRIFKALATFALVFSASSFAQGISGGGISGGGISGISGISGGLGIDFAAAQAGGADSQKPGGLTNAIDAAFGDSSESGDE